MMRYKSDFFIFSVTMMYLNQNKIRKIRMGLFSLSMMNI